MAHLKVWRDKSVREVTAKLDNAEDGTKVAARDASPESRPEELGLRMRPLTREERAQTRLESGLGIECVAGQPARAGVQPGDALLAINGVQVPSLEQVLDRARRQAAQRGPADRS